MRRILAFILPTSILILVFVFLQAAERASGAASNAITGAETRADIEEGGPPWYNDLWHYRRPATIYNPGSDLEFYQVLIKLDNSNFDFDKAKPDGTDLRVTGSSGKNPLTFWIESWDKTSQRAYVWVLTDFLPGVRNSTIYLYYGNPEATPVSDEASPFEFFDDDWSQFLECLAGENYQQLPPLLGSEINTQPRIGQLINNPLTLLNEENLANGYHIGSVSWLSLGSGSPCVESGRLVLNNGTGIKTISSYQNEAIGFQANFGLGAGREWGGFIDGSSGKMAVIGDLITDTVNLYLRNSNIAETHIQLSRVGSIDWHGTEHIYEVRWCDHESNCPLKPNDQSVGDIDHGVRTRFLETQVPNTLLPVTFYNNNSGSASTLKVDWVYVRQYRDPEPTASVGAEQGLVELGISMVDYPDPLRRGEELSYLLTIENNSVIDAPNVVVTDTLPENVQFDGGNPDCYVHQVGVVVCNFDSIPSNSSVNTTIVVIPTVDGLITNTVVVTSPGYETNLSNNSAKEATLVDTVPPVVNWEQPVKNGENYLTPGGMVLLEASAEDHEDQVARVEFILWDHNSSSWITIGSDNTSSYQVQFDIDTLECSQVYQVYVIGVDRAGNRSNPYNPLRVIYIERTSCRVWLPFAVK